MLVLITYDVNTGSAGGRKRLRRVAKICTDYGQRVQNSVFECIVDNSQAVRIRNKLEGEIDKQTDSLRFYYLGKNYSGRVEHIGVKESYDADGPLII